MTKTYNKIKILYIHHGSGIGGAPISLLNLIKKLDLEKFEVKVLFFVEGVICELYRESNIEVEILNASMSYFGHHSKGKISLKYFHRYPGIAANWLKIALHIAPGYLSKNKEFDIVHLNSDVLSSWAYAAKKLGFKVVCHNRDPIGDGYFGLRKRILQNLLSKNVDKIISISKDNSIRLGLSEKTEVVYNFVSLPEKYKAPFSSRDVKVLYLGGNAKIKGFQTAVNCLPYLDNGIIVQFAGNYNSWKKSNSLKESIINVIKTTFYKSTYLPLIKLLKAKNAEVLGLLKNPYPYIDTCDILITPFSVEHFSRPAMEAFSYGKPVIGSNVEGMDEIIDHEVNGLLIEKNNPKALAEAINYLSANPEIGKTMGLKGRQKAETVFAPEVNTGKVEAIYRDLLK